ncbi:amidohydrolase [Microbacterium resistens]|uniref:Peptidase M20 domain-containing protein 2 n=1 Tax=Microbacterium resistens TaxID=156977 RepID=A0ABU1S7V3_9MICO|nr:M20 family metallopeptidase [Microbacterium resistens]MDR6865681.1 amidohydrolase [Microbacterium resistens]
MSHDTIDAAVDELRDALIGLSHQIHALAEPGFEETRSAEAVRSLLSALGHDARVGGYGLSTSLEARAGSGAPTIALMAEYDALPGIGHACGHNVIAASAVGAFLATARSLQESGAPGTIVLLGTPAEENGTGKEVMARHGAFEGIDAALMIHPTGGDDLPSGRSLGLREVEIVFQGRASHASAAPQFGINALDAAVAAYQGIATLRQSLLVGDQVHGIITDGGERPNVIPERAALHFYVRSPSSAQLLDISRRIEEIAYGAARMIGATVELVWDRYPACLPMQSNEPLSDRFTQWMETIGRSTPVPHSIERGLGSTDAGNVSVRIPTIHPMISIAPAGIVPHTERFAHEAVSEAADRAIVESARGLAHTALDYLTSATLRAAAAEAFERERNPAVNVLLAGSEQHV